MGKKKNIRFVRRDDTTYFDRVTEIFGCGDCGKVFVVDHKNKTQAESWATDCCNHKCSQCKADVKYYGMCSDCRDKKFAEKVEGWFEKAEKKSWRDYDGPVWSEDSDQFHQDVGDFHEHWESCHMNLDNDLLDQPIPKYVWACHENRLQIPDAGEMMANAEENASLDSDLDYDWQGVKELTAAVNTFNDKQTQKVWEPNYKVAILLEGINESK